MKTRSPNAALALRARSTKVGSDAAGRSPGQSTPRSERGSRRSPSKRRAGDADGSVNVVVICSLSHAREGTLEPCESSYLSSLGLLQPAQFWRRLPWVRKPSKPGSLTHLGSLSTPLWWATGE